jgi:two-component system, OmpR family, phosphate regulon sensor histidine kinase PhoR
LKASPITSYPFLVTLLAAVCAVLALLFLALWARARAEAARADVRLAANERLLTTLRQAAAEQASLTDALQQAQLDAVLVVTAAGTIKSLNAAARALFGSQAEAGQTVMLVTRSVELDELAAHCLAGGSDCDRQVRLGLGYSPYRARAVLAGADEHRAVVLVLQDLSELQRLGRARRDFVANISHELRTPLTSIRLLVDTLRGHAALEPAARDDLLEKIYVETEALGQLSQELLDLAQIESGQALLRLVPTRVADLVGSVTERLGPQAERKQLNVHVDMPAGLFAWADAAQLTRALGSLLHNAIKFTPAGGEIHVSAAPSANSGEVIIAVADTGPGILPEDLPRVFERFFRGDKARAGGGTGLGLAIAKHVVEAHGGRLWVESEGRPGRGAVFRMSLTVAEPVRQ